MKAVILAAGKGTRMCDLTADIPKPMLRVQERPILEHILSGLAANGIVEFCIITGWHREVVEDYFGDGARWNVRVSYAYQEVQDGTGKAPELARAFVGEDDFLLTYGDILVKPETYAQMASRFHTSGAAGVLTVTRGEDVTKGGICIFDDEFFLKRLVEKPSAAQLAELQQAGLWRPGDPAWYNAGIYIFRPNLFEYTARLLRSPRGEFELTDAIAAMVQAGQRLAGLEIAGRWVDVRDPEVLAALNRGEL